MQLFVSISISSDAEDEGELSFAFLIFLFPLTYLRILFSRVFPQLFCLQIHVFTDWFTTEAATWGVLWKKVRNFTKFIGKHLA